VAGGDSDDLGDGGDELGGVTRVAPVGVVGGDEAALALCQQHGVAELGRLVGLALADRAGVRVAQRHQPVGDHPVTGQPLPGLVQQPTGCGRGLHQPGHQPSQPAVVGPFGPRPAGVAGDLLGLDHGAPGDGPDLGGEPVDLGGDPSGASPQGPGDLPEPPARGAGAVAKRRAGGRAALLGLADQPTRVRTARSSRSASVGWSMSASTTVVSILSLRQRRTLSPASFASSAALSCSIVLGPARPTSSGQGGRVRHGLVQADVAEPPPGDRVGDLAAQALVAKLVAMLEVQQPQQGLDRQRRAPQPGGKQRPQGVMKRSSSR
jgi:hypothetical protein